MRRSVNLPLVTVVMPVYNASDGIEDAFNTLHNLTYLNLEIVVVDDGSTDDTADHVARLVKNEERASFVTLPQNSGPGVARNEGLRRARGKYVWFVDWDDEWEPTIIDRLVGEAETEDADLVSCRGKWRDSSGRDSDFTDGLQERRVISASETFDLILEGKIRGYLWNKLFRRSILPQNLFPSLNTQEDFCAIVSLTVLFRTVVCIPDVLYYHVTRSGSLSNSSDPVLRNLTVARSTVHSVASSFPTTQHRSQLLNFYDYSYWHVDRVITAIRLSSRQVAVNQISDVRRLMKYREILRVARTSVKVALVAFSIKALGRHFMDFRRYSRSLRSALRAVPRSIGHKRTAITDRRSMSRKHEA